MGWVSDKAVITAIITAPPYSYVEIAGNKDLVNERPSTSNHKGFSLRPLNPDTTFITARHNISSRVCELVVSYICKDNASYDADYELWETLLTAIRTTHYGYVGTPQFIRHPQDTSFCYGKVQLKVGVISE